MYGEKPVIRKPSTTDNPELDGHIDDMIDEWERSGTRYDKCRAGMVNALSYAREPLAIADWVEKAHYDGRGRVKYTPDVFHEEAVKKVVLDLLRQKQIVRVGRQSFCAIDVIVRMNDHINCLLLWSCAVMDMEDIAEKILSSKSEKIKKDRGFVEEKIIREAIDYDSDCDESNIMVLHDNIYIHRSTIEVCTNFVAGYAGKLDRLMTDLEIVDAVNRGSIVGMDSQYDGRSVKAIRNAFMEPMIRAIVLDNLLQQGVFDQQDGKFKPLPKQDTSKKYRSLDDD